MVKLEPYFPNVGRHRRLVGKLIYLTVTHPDITYVVGVVSQFMHALRQPHFVAMCRILQYLKRAPGRGSIAHLPLCLLLASVMLIGLVIRLTAIPPRAIVLLLVVILLLGVGRNRLLLLVLVLMLSIVPWLILLLRCFRFNLFSKI